MNAKKLFGFGVALWVAYFSSFAAGEAIVGEPGQKSSAPSSGTKAQDLQNFKVDIHFKGRPTSSTKSKNDDQKGPFGLTKREVIKSLRDEALKNGTMQLNPTRQFSVYDEHLRGFFEWRGATQAADTYASLTGDRPSPEKIAEHMKGWMMSMGILPVKSPSPSKRKNMYSVAQLDGAWLNKYDMQNYLYELRRFSADPTRIEVTNAWDDEFEQLNITPPPDDAE